MTINKAYGDQVGAMEIKASWTPCPPTARSMRAASDYSFLFVTETRR